MRVIILSCCSHYVTHRWWCIYLSLLFPRCTSAFFLPGLPWWEGLHQKAGAVLLILSALWKHDQQNKNEVLQAWTQSHILSPWHNQPAATAAESSCCCHYFLFHIKVITGRLRLLIVTQRRSSSAEEEMEHLQGYQAITILDNLYSGAVSWHSDISLGIRPT